jgi:hypothetical protein
MMTMMMMMMMMMMMIIVPLLCLQRALKEMDLSEDGEHKLSYQEFVAMNLRFPFLLIPIEEWQVRR